MPIKKVGVTPEAEPKIKRVTNKAGGGDRVTKDDLVDKVALYTTREFDPAHNGDYGTTKKWVGDIFLIDTEEALTDVWVMGEAGGQLGRELLVGETGCATMTHGTAEKSGRQFYGISWAEDAEVFAAAEAALRKAEAGY